MTTLSEIRQTNQEGVLREKIIVRTSMIGIVANIFLVIFKTTIQLDFYQTRLQLYLMR